MANTGYNIPIPCNDEPVEITVNAVDFGTSEPGTTFNVPVINTDNVEVGSKVGSDWVVPDGEVTVNSVAFDTVPSDGTLNIPVVNQDDVAVGAKVGNDWVVTEDRSVFLKGIFVAGNSALPSITIDADNAGTYTAQTTDGSSGTITYSINAGAFAAFSNPTTLAIGDTLVVQRTSFAAAGYYKLTGTYV